VVAIEAYKEINCCRSCGGRDLEEFWSAGEVRIVEFPKIGELPSKPKAPLSLVLCRKCHLVQLRHTVDPKYLYEEFWYRSGTNEMMREELGDIAASMGRIANLQPGDAVLDIGCNDGTLLNYYSGPLKKVGIDPAKNIEAQGEWIRVQDYFSSEKALEASSGQKYRAVTAIAMFYDLDNPVQFLDDVEKVLASDGVLCIQMNYLPKMLWSAGADNVCHEHLTYFSLHSMQQVLREADLRIVRAEVNKVNGGSLRVYAQKPYVCAGEVEEWNVGELLDYETQAGLDTIQPYYQFAYRVSETVKVLNRWLSELNAANKAVYAYGASTRGTTLLQLLDTEGKLIACAERDARKFGRYMVSGDLLIISEDEARAKADYFFVLPWHFLPAIEKRESEWMKRGGKLIAPLPDPRIISRNGEHSC